MSSLAALAWPRRAEAGAATLVPCLDARRGEPHAAGFRADADGLAPVLHESVWEPAALAAALAGPCLLVGEGCEALAEALAAVGRPPLGAIAARPGAAAVGVLGARMLARGEGRDAAELVPRYLRRAEAEARRTGQALEPGGPGPAGEAL